MSDSGPEWLVAEDTSEMVWLRFKRLTSIVICRRLLGERCGSLKEKLREEKASGLAWSVRAALDFWTGTTAALNSKALSRYYALLQMTIAEQVASAAGGTLVEAQRHTESGHGLFTISDPAKPFPQGFYVGCLKSGHFASYCRFAGIDVSAYAFEKRPRKWEKTDEGEKAKLLSLSELFARVPELQGVVGDCLEVEPMSFPIWVENPGVLNGFGPLPLLRDCSTKQTVTFPAGQTPTNAELSSLVGVRPLSPNIQTSDIAALDLPIEQLTEATDPLNGSRYFTGFVWHRPGQFWSSIPTYKSGYSATSVVKPYWGNRDVLVLNFVILYAISIIVRYLPNTWHEIEIGQSDNVRSLVETYLAVFDKVVPLLAIQRITGRPLVVMQPGSLQAPL